MGPRGFAFLATILLLAQLTYYIFLILFVNGTDETCPNTSDGDKSFLTAVEVITYIEAIGVVIMALRYMKVVVSGPSKDQTGLLILT